MLLLHWILLLFGCLPFTHFYPPTLASRLLPLAWKTQIDICSICCKIEIFVEEVVGKKVLNISKESPIMYFATQSFQSPRKQIFIWRIYNRLVDFSRQQDIIGQDYLLINPLYPNMKEIITEIKSIWSFLQSFTWMWSSLISTRLTVMWLMCKYS